MWVLLTITINKDFNLGQGTTRRSLSRNDLSTLDNGADLQYSCNILALLDVHWWGRMISVTGCYRIGGTMDPFCILPQWIPLQLMQEIACLLYYLNMGCNIVVMMREILYTPQVSAVCGKYWVCRVELGYVFERTTKVTSKQEQWFYQDMEVRFGMLQTM